MESVNLKPNEGLDLLSNILESVNKKKLRGVYEKKPSCKNQFTASEYVTTEYGGTQ